MFAMQIAAAIEDARPQGLDHLRAPLWKAYAAGLIDDETTQRLAERIEARRRADQGAIVATVAPCAGRRSIFPERAPSKAKAHPERIGRRRRLAASYPMPPALAAEWTTGALSVLRIVGDEVRESGFCDRSLKEIADRAGVCRSLAQSTIRRAAKLGLVTIEERQQAGAKNLPNVVRIISAEWMTWLRRGPKASDKAEDAGIGSRKTAPLETHISFRDEFVAILRPKSHTARRSPPRSGPRRSR